MKNVIIVGTGGHAKAVAETVIKTGDSLAGFLTCDTDKDTFIGMPVLGSDTDYKKYGDCYFIIAVGDPEAREKIVSFYKNVKWYTAVHPSAAVSDIETCIGEGTVVMANAVINPCAKIGKHCIINSGAIVEHDDIIEDFAHISVGAKLAGHVKIGCRTWIGIGAAVCDDLTICENCLVGAGAAVTKDIEVPGTYAGVPAKKIK